MQSKQSIQPGLLTPTRHRALLLAKLSSLHIANALIDVSKYAAQSNGQVG
jgi:hypothetical protein